MCNILDKISKYFKVDSPAGMNKHGWRDYNALAMSKWDESPNLEKHEWPDNTLSWLHHTIIDKIIDLRSATGKPMFPSPVYGAHVRHSDSNSLHSTKNNTRLSKASDLFIRPEDMWDIWFKSIDMGFKGIGLYFNKWYGFTDNIMPMIHLDTRDNFLLWVSEKNGEYVYHTDPYNFFRIITRNLSRFQK